MLLPLFAEFFVTGAIRMNLWKQEYRLDLDVIDTQHKQFFSLCAEVAQLAETTTSDRKAVEIVIRKLGAIRSYAFFHFKTEEEIMLKFRYPGYLEHTSFHNGYLQKMIEFEQEFRELLSGVAKGEGDDQKLRAYLGGLSEFVADWWGDHIVSQDRLYAAHIKENKSAMKDPALSA